MNSKVIANVLSLFAGIFSAVSGNKKDKKEILFFQEMMQLSYIAANALLKGYSGLVQNAVGFIRNLFLLKEVKNSIINYFLVILALILGLYFNNLSYIGLLPVFTGALLSLVMIKENNVTIIKAFMILNSSAYVIYSLALQNIISAIINLVTVITIFCSLNKRQ